MNTKKTRIEEAEEKKAIQTLEKAISNHDARMRRAEHGSKYPPSLWAKLLIGAVLLSASCTSNQHRQEPRVGDWSMRASAGAEQTTVRTVQAGTFLGNPYVRTEEHDGDTTTARIEAVNVLEDGWRVGPYLDLGIADFDGVDGNHASLGAFARYYLTPGLYAEGRAGVRGQELGELSGVGFDLGAAVGVEYRGFFLQVGYGYGEVSMDTPSVAQDDLSTQFHGANLMIGGTINF